MCKNNPRYYSFLENHVGLVLSRELKKYVPLTIGSPEFVDLSRVLVRFTRENPLFIGL
jgi:hypothetical protein